MTKCQLKFLANLKSGAAIDGTDILAEGPYPVYGGNGLRGYTETKTHLADAPLIGRQGALCGNVNYASGDFYATEHAIVAMPRDGVSPRWLFWLLASLNLGQYSMAAAQPGLAVDAVGRLRVRRNALGEQERIANFLDEKTARIDALIAEKERLLTSIKDYRTSAIDAEVTGRHYRGERQHTRFEFSQNVPVAWVMKRLKHISPEMTVGIVVNPSDYYSEDGKPFVFGGDISEEGLDVDTTRRISDEGNASNAKSRLRVGDLVTVRVGEPGLTAVVPPAVDGGNCASVMLTRGHLSFDSHWLAACMNSSVGRHQVKLVEYGAAMKQFNLSHAREFWFPVPPLQTQQEIAKSVAEIQRRTRDLAEHVREHISLLREYRSSLISAAVTGRLSVDDVRHRSEQVV